jgi:3-hydroxyacyl-CoA dehydrogenase
MIFSYCQERILYIKKLRYYQNYRVGQPEVQIGLIPGGGGTIRLPKAAGLKNALDIITTGNHVPAEKALKMGIIDQVILFTI